jgi:AraC-like DNA-binding protein
VLTRWERIKAAERMLDHIEARLDQRITMSELARAARYSPFHAARLFKELTGKAPFEYIRARRLSVAAQRLADSPCRVVDVALDFVFDSHEGFTRAFSRQFGVNPRDFRKNPSQAELFLPPRLRDGYSKRQQGEIPMSEPVNTPTVFVQVLDRPARKLILKRGRQATHYFEYCEEVGCDVWDQLSAMENITQEPMGLWLPENMRRPGTSTYAQGVEVAQDYAGPVPEGFEIIDLPACKMMVFQGPPFEDRDFESAIESLWDVMTMYRPETFGFTWADQDAPRFQLRPEGYRGYIEGRPVRGV